MTRRRIRLRKTVKTFKDAEVELGKLIAKAASGGRPDSAVTVAELMDAYVPVAEWGASTRTSKESHIRRIIKPALGHLEVRRVRGPLLDQLYARLKRCSEPGCTGKPRTEHRNIPDLAADPAGSRPAWQQVTDTLRQAIQAGQLARGDPLPSVQELHDLQGIRTATLQHALAVLAAEGLIIVRQGRTAVVAGEPEPGAVRPLPGHDCREAGCQPHVCSPMKPKTIRNIHSILSGAFAAAQRWEWADRNPAESAKPPAITQGKRPANPPEDVAAVIAACREAHPPLALYLWLAAITGARRGELCGLQIRDLDLDHGIIHVAFSYLVTDGQRLRKDTKTHQDRHLAIDAVTSALLLEHLETARARLASIGLELPQDAYLFSNDPLGATAWNPDWASHKVSELAARSRVHLTIKGLRHYTASQLLAARFDLQNTAARLGHGGATTLRHYADPVSEVVRRAATYLSELTASARVMPVRNSN